VKTDAQIVCHSLAMLDKPVRVIDDRDPRRNPLAGDVIHDGPDWSETVTRTWRDDKGRNLVASVTRWTFDGEAREAKHIRQLGAWRARWRDQVAPTLEERALAAARLVSLSEITDDRQDLADLLEDLEEQADEERLLAIGLDELAVREPTVRRYRVRLTRSLDAIARHDAWLDRESLPGRRGERQVDVFVRAEVLDDGSVKRWGASLPLPLGNTVHLSLWLEPEELAEVDRQIFDAARARGAQGALFA
jgi:hypothetical protein